MVLQMAPLQATVWGFVEAGASVTVEMNGHTVHATTSMWLNESTWLAKLPATEGSLKQYNISATSGASTITLSGVLFGDVFVCSGQSNMAYTIGTPTCWDPSNIDCHKKPNDAQCSYGCTENAGAEIAGVLPQPPSLPHSHHKHNPA